MTDQEKLHSGANVPIVVAAKVMRKDPQFIRLCLQQGRFPFGVALKKKEDGKKYDYYISPQLFLEYTGYDYLAEMEKGE
jgi:hypothetical protein